MENGFSELYKYCQTLTPKVSKKSIRDKVKEITGEFPILIKTSLDTSTSRGFFVSADNNESKYHQMIGGRNAIIIARGMNDCWERFVYTKELMHVFDKQSEYVGSSEELKNVLNGFEIHMLNGSESFLSETIAFWRALCCLCPEESRQEFIKLHSKGHIDNYGIALQLRIPEQYVPLLLDNRFSDTIKKIT